LIVSHDKAAIQAICDEAILLNAGRLAMQGEPEAVMDYYNAMIAEKENSTVQQATTADGRIQTTSGTGEATVSSIRLLDAKGQPAEVVAVGSRATLQVTVQVHQPVDNLVFGYMIKDRLGQPIFGTNTYHLGQQHGPLAPGQTLALDFDFEVNLGEGSYSVATAIADSETHLTHNYEWRDLALVFQVMNLSVPPFVGSVYLPTHVRTPPHEQAD
jgi:lipopolysaccharide transport system ATP-binding protein